MANDTVRIDAVKPRARGSRTGRVATSTDFWTFPVLVWTIHWLLTQIPATLAYHYGSVRSQLFNYGTGRLEDDFGPASGAYGEILPPMSGLAGWLVEPFRNWDGTWYRLVADSGYDTGSAEVAFWPLYPRLMGWGAELTGWSSESIGYILSRLAFLGALVFVYRLVQLDFNVQVAERTLWALALFPTSFFFSAIYTESLFLLFAAGALFYARRGEWLLAGLIGLLGALTRSAGVMILAPFAVLFIRQYGWAVRRWFPHALLAALPALGPVLFGWYLTRIDRGFFDWANQQWQWNRFSATPWRTFDCTLNGCTAQVRSFSSDEIPFDVRPIDWGWFRLLLEDPTWGTFTSSEFRFRVGQSYVLDLVVTVLAIALIVIGLRRVPFYYTAFVIPPLLVPLITPSSVFPLMSVPRFVLPLFPLFVVVALLVQKRRVAIGLAVASSVLLVLLTMQFVQWYWVS